MLVVRRQEDHRANAHHVHLLAKVQILDDRLNVVLLAQHFPHFGFGEGVDLAHNIVDFLHPLKDFGPKDHVHFAVHEGELQGSLLKLLKLLRLLEVLELVKPFQVIQISLAQSVLAQSNRSCSEIATDKLKDPIEIAAANSKIS